MIFQSRDAKLKLILYQINVKSKSIDRKELEIKINQLKKHLITTDREISRSLIVNRRTFLSNNKDIRNIFLAFWLALLNSGYVKDSGELSKEGYVKFFYALEVALLGFQSYESLENYFSSLYNQDLLYFGSLNQESFFDLLFEFCELWSNFVGSKDHKLFLWALLGIMSTTTTTYSSVIESS